MLTRAPAVDHTDTKRLHRQLIINGLSSPFRFSVHATDGAARFGQCETPRGAVHTPAFMPVGTQGAINAALPREVAEARAELVLGNPYPLYLRPVPELI